MRTILCAVLAILVATTALPQGKALHGTWSATSGTSGAAFSGSWEATAGDDATVVTGSWTAADQRGTPVAGGTWSARKDGKMWKGTWQARTTSGQVYSGTWRAESRLPGTDGFLRLFEAAAAKIASGTWQMGTSASGAWSIRADARN